MSDNRHHQSSAYEKSIIFLANSLNEKLIDAHIPSPQEAIDILTALEEESHTKKHCTMSIAILESTKIGKLLTKTIKVCKRHKRGCSDKDRLRWDEAITTSERLIASFKQAADSELATLKKNTEKSNATGLPQSTSVYRSRLLSQSKELYKDPPSPPPPHIVIEPDRVSSPPTRNNSGELTFSPGADQTLKTLLKEFHPNRTPEEILRAGAFGGTYFRPIVSAVTNLAYNPSQVMKDTVSPQWISGLKANMLTSSKYDASVNKYKVSCGGSLGMWESSGWISDCDPYGWFQWYCRFYTGRRCSDDGRQIDRWRKLAGERGRFKSQLCNKIIASGVGVAEVSVSPVVRQTLLHWGLEITEEVLERHKRRK